MVTPVADVDAYLAEVDRWRAARIRRLTDPEGWLSLVGLAWLEEGENPVGSGPSSRVVLPAPWVPARLGAIVVRDGAASIRVDVSSPDVTRDGEAVTTLDLVDDRDGDPTVLRVGTIAFHVIERDGHLAVRIKDGESPAREAFAGIEHYPVDPAWRLEGRFEPYDPPRRIVVPDALGRDAHETLPGAVAFDIGGTTHRIDVFDEAGTDDLFLVFGDLTNRTETFGAGRYLYTPPPGPDGAVVIDFNRAYNPPCVFTPYATCSLPPPQNRLPIRIEAGEKRYAAGKAS